VAAKRRRRICRLLAPKTGAGLFSGFSAAGNGKRPGILVKQTVAIARAVGVVIAVAVGMMAVLQAVAVGSVGSSRGCRAFAEQCSNLL
jgi:hypothetical protein